MSVLAGRFGGGSFGGSRTGGFSSRVGSSSRSGSSSRPRTTTRLGGTRGTVINHVHVYAPSRVHGGRSYGYRYGGWGYGYYGPHPYFDTWYGYPVYYGAPWHWSGWDWSWAPLLALLVVVLLVAGAVGIFRMLVGDTW